MCVLLALIMLLSCFTVGVSAYKTNYTTCSYSSVKKPVFTKEQAASAVLDYLDDEVLAGLDVNFLTQSGLFQGMLFMIYSA